MIKSESQSYEELKARIALLERQFNDASAENRWRLAIVDSVQSRKSIDELLLIFRDLIIKEFGFDRVGIFFYDGGTDTMRGSWGTDEYGNVEDLSSYIYPFSEAERKAFESLKAQGKEVILRHFEPDDERIGFPESMQKIQDHAEIYLTAAGNLVGYIAVDNLLTNRPISESQIQTILPFTRNAALGLYHTWMRAVRESGINRQKQIMDMSLAITSNRDPDEVFLMVRNAIMEVGSFDRAGVWVIEGPIARATWGTNPLGELRDEHDRSAPISEMADDFSVFVSSDLPFVIKATTIEGPNGEIWNDVPHALIPLKATGEFIGFVAVDTLLTRRPITPAMVIEVLPIVDQAAIALVNAKLRTQREAVIEQQRRVMEITLALSQNEDIDKVFLMVRNAIVEIGKFERAAVWTVENFTAIGTWGTDEYGILREEHSERFPIDPGGKYFAPLVDQERLFVIDKFGVTMPLRVGQELLGIITVDMLLSGRPITDEMVSAILPIVDQAAVAVQKSRMLDQRQEMVRQQQRIMEIAAAIAENGDPDMVLKMVRDAVLSTGYADRAGVWLVDGLSSHGTWGTDRDGKPIDEHGAKHSLIRFAKENPEFMSGDLEFVIADHHQVTLKNGEKRSNVPFATIRLRANNKLVGLITIDNLISMREITPQVLEMLLPLAKQAAIAILNSRLRSERESVIKHQKRLLEIAVAISENQDTDVVFQMVRDAVMETQFVDRASVWLIDGDIAHGTWGTDSLGRRIDEHGITFVASDCLEQYTEWTNGRAKYILDVLASAQYVEGEIRTEIPHAVIPLRAGAQVVGLLTVDTLSTMREISSESVELILPLANLAAVVVVKHRLLEDARKEIERRREVESLLIGQTYELVVARDAALEATKAKSQFLANMSHEIRTPMNGVLGLTSLLMLTPLSAEQYGYTSGVQKSAEALLTVINDILDFSRLEAGMLKLNLHPFNLRECISDVVKTFGASMMTEAVALKCVIPPDFPEWLIGDGDRVRQLVTNLVDNAVKFTHKGSIFVGVTCLEQTKFDAKVQITITDTGIGIPKDRQAAVFESFTQADGSLTRRHGGSGLGLTITKQIVELMGGSIHLTSRPGEGTTIRIDLLVEKQPLDAISPINSTVDDRLSLGLKVLVAEDNHVNAIVTIARLELWGCECVAVENGLEALQSIKARNFDIVLMDVSMPEMDGIQATREIRKLEETTGRHTPIIALTAHAMVGDQDRCLVAGMDDYLSKPVNFTELLQKLQLWSKPDRR